MDEGSQLLVSPSVTSLDYKHKVKSLSFSVFLSTFLSLGPLPDPHNPHLPAIYSPNLNMVGSTEV